ncbi:MAG TPA: O-antigen ligase family protein [Roseiarcus sp.]|nr:O-antigen ligase family protein [Roseiarcus sp.]
MSGEAKELDFGSRLRSLDWRTIDFLKIAEPLAVASPLALIISAQELVMAVISLLFLAHSWRERDWAWARRSWFVAALGLWAYAFLRTLLIHPTATGVLTALQWIHFALYAAALAEWILPRPQIRDRLLWATVATMTFYALDCLLQYEVGRDIIGRPTPDGRLTSVFHKPGVGAEIGWLYLPAMVGLWGKGYPLAGAALGLISIVAVLLSGDRMGLLIALTALILFCILAARIRRTLLVAAPAAALLIGAILYFNPAIYQRQVETTATIIERIDQSVYGVLVLTALEVTRDHPVFGVGVHQYQKACLNEKYGPPLVGRFQYKRCQGHPHNVYAQWLAEGGVIGLVLYASFAIAAFGSVFQIARAHRGDLVLSALAVCVALRFWPIETSTSFYSSWAAEPLFLVLGWALSYRKAEVEDG